jgi:transposase-like protein
MIECKNCHATRIIKSGFVREKQRYKCKECGVHFVEGDARTSEKIIALKALCVVFYSLGKGSYNMLGKLFGRNRSLIYRWIREAGLGTEKPAIGGEIKQIEFDEIWHFIESKKANFGSSKPLIVAAGGLSSGFSVVVIAQRSADYTTKSSI